MVLDLACGAGRHVKALRALGFSVVALDRDANALASFDADEKLVADLETAPWPLADRRFDGIVVTNYLHRELFPRLSEALEPEGILIYETFALGNEAFGRPSNPRFLLAPGELLELSRGLTVLAYEHGVVSEPRPACVQRVCAARCASPEPNLRYQL